MKSLEELAAIRDKMKQTVNCLLYTSPLSFTVGVKALSAFSVLHEKHSRRQCDHAGRHCRDGQVMLSLIHI